MKGFFLPASARETSGGRLGQAVGSRGERGPPTDSAAPGTAPASDDAVCGEGVESPIGEVSGLVAIVNAKRGNKDRNHVP